MPALATGRRTGLLPGEAKPRCRHHPRTSSAGPHDQHRESRLRVQHLPSLLPKLHGGLVRARGRSAQRFERDFPGHRDLHQQNLAQQKHERRWVGFCLPP